ncbi:hypothetical protein [Myceligenerans indicum]|uniref:CobQ/CobB/MinD/ParA nucleotide binding domain-containing protein n=1 Tax=Myceligenerans indicum TaxID=2593663 RepID=A0ABS1LF21_9MICO|nr:hypothetical protein [Myceligenerans indicum]MBL0884836.1 hypothetical protein [Myceligenerans indicum]
MRPSQHPSPAPTPLHLIVAGVAGGVGTTTVAAALARTLAAAMPGRVGLLDHDGGTLFARAGVWSDDLRWARPGTASVHVQCLGSAAAALQRVPPSTPGLVALVVAPWHKDGLRLAAGVVAGAAAVEPLILLDDVTRARDGQEPAVRSRLGLPYDRALAAPGALQDDRASHTVRTAVGRAADEVLRRAGSREPAVPHQG